MSKVRNIRTEKFQEQGKIVWSSLFLYFRSLEKLSGSLVPYCPHRRSSAWDSTEATSHKHRKCKLRKKRNKSSWLIHAFQIKLQRMKVNLGIIYWILKRVPFSHCSTRTNTDSFTYTHTQHSYRCLKTNYRSFFMMSGMSCINSTFEKRTANSWG